MISRARGGSWLVAAMLLGIASEAAGHAFRPGVLTLVEGAAGRYGVTWQRPSGLETADAVRPVFAGGCAATGDPIPFGDGVERWEIDCGFGGLRGAAIGARGLGATRTDVAVQIMWRSGPPFSAMLRPGAEILEAPAGPPRPGTWAAALIANYGRLGVEHIWLGADHLAFVFGLFLLARTWHALVWTITAFTVAHSLSLALSIFDVLRLRSAPVEAAIALSVLLLAGELARDERDTLTRRRPWLVAGAFGLVHGLGFAGALRAIGIPEGQATVALAGFNVGVEVGQVAVVVVLMLAAAAVRSLGRRVPRLVTAPVYAMGTLAAAWTMARVAAAVGWEPSAF